MIVQKKKKKSQEISSSNTILPCKNVIKELAYIEVKYMSNSFLPKKDIYAISVDISYACGIPIKKKNIPIHNDSAYIPKRHYYI